MIIKKIKDPSIENPVRLTRDEKMGMILLSYAATVLDDLRKEMHDRIGMVWNGHERMRELAEKAEMILNEMRVTAPMNQRNQLENTANDFEMRLTPKATPGTTNVIMQKEEFRTLVDFARSTCKECTLDDEECETCELFQLLTVILPLDEYHDRMLCPYNLGKWGN